MDRAAGPEPAHAVCLADRVGGLASPADRVAVCGRGYRGYGGYRGYRGYSGYGGAVNGGRQLGIGTGGCFAVWIVC